MAIYHLSVKTLSRSDRRCATAAAAYRSGALIVDEASGEMHDYRRKSGVESATLVLPKGAPEWAHDRAKLWNAAEAAENRKNSLVAREFEIALPAELNAEQRKQLALEFAGLLVNRHGFAADVAIHAPGKEGDNRNHHAHILVTTRKLEADGLTTKTRELDNQRTGRECINYWRELFADLQNQYLEEAGQSARVDHRSLEAQGIEREPTKHLGVHAIGFERRTGQDSRRRITHNEEALEVLAKAKEVGEIERQLDEVEQEIIDLRTDIAAAKWQAAEQAKREAQELIERHAREQAEAKAAKEAQAKRDQEALEAKLGVADGITAFMRRFEEHQAKEAAAKAAQQAEVARVAQEAQRLADEKFKAEALRQIREDAEKERQAEAERQRRRDNDRGMSM